MSNITTQVLVVENDDQTRRLISRLLQDMGIQSILVRDGETALALLEENLTPGLIILALELPQMDGYSVLQRLRADGRFADIPVLALTHSIDVEAVRRGLRAGADGYVTTAYLSQTLPERTRILLAAGRRPQPDTWRMQRTVALDHPDGESDADSGLPEASSDEDSGDG